ncbi:MAG: sugar phosphate isomerase/epimerase [Candidatus Marinimicrobia bacterium]|nr:sugar phosphate isomerase/epimerase [Candidatus Neomarinimicrobiota bacterium]MCH7859130.1 sugar phosphate isomerase/epimerase [Candidatus Neomarinimicrobiota bacterium]
MQLSIVISTQPASFAALLYKGNLDENIARVSSLGYDGVELAVRDPSLLDVPALEALLRKENLVVPAIGTGQAFGEEGLSLTDPDEQIRLKAIDRIKAQVRLARRLGAVVIIGLIRGKQGRERSADQVESLLIEALRTCALEDQTVKLAIEAINRYETDLLNTVASALRLVEELGMDNVGLLLDTFHMNIEEPSPSTSIMAAGDRVFHVHIADSNRWYPGAGHINFGEIVDALDKIGYEGFASAEIMPLPDPVTASKKAVEYMRDLTG